MSNQPPRRRSGVGLGIVFAILGMLIGGPIGSFLMTPRNDLRKNPDPQAQAFATLLSPVEFCFGFVGLLVGGGVGATIGGIVGTAMGARAAKEVAEYEKSDEPATPISEKKPYDAVDETADEEIARLKAKIARLEDQVDDLKDGRNARPAE